MTEQEYRQLAAEVVERARARGAEEAECTISEGDEFSVSVRMREIETLKEAGSRAAGVRVLVDRRAGSSYTSDLTREGLEHMVDSALELARLTTEDPFAGLPEESELGAVAGELGLYSGDVSELSSEAKIRQAREAEEAAFALDPRIVNSEGGSFASRLSLHAFANSRGFSGAYRSSSCSLTAVPVAREGESMERDYWFTAARRAADLEAPGEVGRRAAERALRRLHARKIETTRVPVIFEARAARSLLGSLFDAVNGDAVYRQASFLAGQLGQRVAAECVTVVDDATMPGLFGSSPFDDEGVPSRRTVVVDRGVLSSYLLNTYTARKLGLKTTGNAARGLTGNPGVGHGNLYLERGSKPPAEVLGSVPRAFLVTELMGSGVNIVTGDYSRGAAGLWIEAGEPAYAVSEVTISGNLRDMLMGIEAVADDLEFRGSVAAPMLLIREMTVSGR
ncbi:MAG: TldD/PmbA family protein [Acidobacteria bacterium]|nr:TldD/PmbA family protein [Acidobacteriota bacterium]